MWFLARRLEFFFITLWAALTLNFLIPRMMPGSPVESMMSRFRGRISPSVVKALEVAFGVNVHESLPSQYIDYLNNMVHGNFGISLTFFPEPVGHVILQALPWTLVLIGVTTVLAFALGTLIGMVAAWRHGGIADSVLPPLFVVTGAFPYFWFGLICIYIFYATLHWFPLGFAFNIGGSINWSWDFIGGAIYHAILPAFTILVTSVGGWALTMRNNMVTTLSEDYVRMARAKGLSPFRIMLFYAGRNAILPNITGFAMALGFVLSGALLTEIVFTYPGLGYMLYEAVVSEDLALMQGIFLLITVAVLVAVVLSDLANAWLDPRARERR